MMQGGDGCAEGEEEGEEGAEGEAEEGCSDMEDENFVDAWQPWSFPCPHPLDVEE